AAFGIVCCVHAFDALGDPVRRRILELLSQGEHTALANFYFYIGKTKFTYGAFLNDTINFVITAFVVFIIIKFVNRLIPHKEKEKQENQNKELDTLIEIRDLLKIKSK
ncbi:MscL family protein, partial [Microbispora sp. NPDC046933]|uniref:MscL family protein n=1 Tax=Microbispora sp. NPDC046933 TaxID=3155618 RepID=UPI0033CB028A